MTDFDPGPSSIDGRPIAPSAVDADRIGSAARVDGDENLQSRLDNLPAGGQFEWNFVNLEPGESYGENNTITVPSYTILCLNGATIRPESDHDAVDLSRPMAYAMGPGRIQPPGSVDYTSACLNVDTGSGDFQSSVSESNDNTFGVIGPRIECSPPFGNGSTALKLRSDGNAVGGIGTGPIFNIMVSNADYHVDLITDNGGFLNGVVINGQLGNPVGSRHVRHTNNEGAAAEAQTVIRGSIQADNNEDYAIENQTAQNSVTFKGQLWDPQTASIAAIGGPYIRVETTNNLYNNNTEFATGTVVNGHGSDSGASERPDASDYRVGDIIDWTDTDDGSGTGVYQLLYDKRWSQTGT